MAEFKEISEKAKEIVGKFMDSLDGESQKELHKILPVSLYALMPDADDAILKPLEEYRVDLNEKLDKKEIAVLKKEFPAVVRYCYENHNARDLQHLDQLIELSRSGVFFPTRDSKYLLPFAGDARWTHYLVGTTFNGYEPSSKIWAYSQILCSAYPGDAKIQLGDSSKIREGEKYDYILAQLLDRRDVSGVVNELCDLMDNHFDEKGVMCCLLPESFCYASEWYDFRKMLCDEKNDLGCFLTAFPAILPEYTKDNICMLWAIKGLGVEERGIVFVSAKNSVFYEQIDVADGSLDFRIKIKDILEEIFDNHHKNYGVLISLKALSKDNNLNLLPTRYLLKKQVCGEGAEEFIPFKNGNGSEEGEKLPHLFQRCGGGTFQDWVTISYNNFMGNRRLGDEYHRSFEKKVVSLYSIMPNADRRILDSLAEYRVDLSECLSPDSLSILRSEFKSIVRECAEEGYDQHGDVNSMFGCLLEYRPQHSVLPPMFMAHHKIFDMCRTLMLNSNSFGKSFSNKKKFKSGSRVLLPYAGNAQFTFNPGSAQLVRNLEKCFIDAYEPDPKAWAFAQILRDAYDLDVEIRSGNAFEGTDGEQYDYVFASLFGRKDLQSIAGELYNIADKRLKNKGVMCCLLPESFCYAPEWYELRKTLSYEKNQYSAVVISLPDVLEPLFTGNVCIFCLHKGVENGLVYLMNAKDDGFLKRIKEDPEFDGDMIVREVEYYDFDVEAVFKALSLQDERYVDMKRFALNEELNFLPTRHLLEYEYNSYEMSRLTDIIELVSLSDTDTDGDKGGTYLSFAALSLIYHNCDVSSEPSKEGFIDMSSKTERYSVSYYKNVITDKCLLAGCLNGRIKVGRVDATSSSPFELSREIIPFKLKSDVVSEEYLLRCLMSDDVAEQAKMLSWGGFYNCIDPEDFLQIMIPVPDKEEQDRLCREDVRNRLEVADQKLKDAFKDFREDMHMKRHAIGQTIFDFNNWWNELQDARRGNKALTDETIVGDSTVKDIYDRLQDALSRLQQQIYKLDRGNGLAAEDFALTTFMEEFIENHQSPVFEFEYNVEKHHVSEDVPDYKEIIDKETGQLKMTRDGWICRKGDPCLDEYVHFPLEALTMVLENIVSNACSHGFTDDSSKENKIRIDFEWVGGYVVATVANNGKPLNRELQPNEVFLYGKSSKNGKGHYGLGGYEIKRLMQEFGGDAEIESTPTEEFTFSYKLTFPEALSGHTYEMNILSPQDAQGSELNNSEQTEN